MNRLRGTYFGVALLLLAGFGCGDDDAITLDGSVDGGVDGSLDGDVDGGGDDGTHVLYMDIEATTLESGEPVEQLIVALTTPVAGLPYTLEFEGDETVSGTLPESANSLSLVYEAETEDNAGLRTHRLALNGEELSFDETRAVLRGENGLPEGVILTTDVFVDSVQVTVNGPRDALEGCVVEPNSGCPITSLGGTLITADSEFPVEFSAPRAAYLYAVGVPPGSITEPVTITIDLPPHTTSGDGTGSGSRREKMKKARRRQAIFVEENYRPAEEDDARVEAEVVLMFEEPFEGPPPLETDMTLDWISGSDGEPRSGNVPLSQGVLVERTFAGAPIADIEDVALFSEEGALLWSCAEEALGRGDSAYCESHFHRPGGDDTSTVLVAPSEQSIRGDELTPEERSIVSLTGQLARRVSRVVITPASGSPVELSAAASFVSVTLDAPIPTEGESFAVELRSAEGIMVGSETTGPILGRNKDDAHRRAESRRAFAHFGRRRSKSKKLITPPTILNAAGLNSVGAWAVVSAQPQSGSAETGSDAEAANAHFAASITVPRAPTFASPEAEFAAAEHRWTRAIFRAEAPPTGTIEIEGMPYEYGVGDTPNDLSANIQIVAVSSTDIDAGGSSLVVVAEGPASDMQAAGFEPGANIVQANGLTMPMIDFEWHFEAEAEAGAPPIGAQLEASFGGDTVTVQEEELSSRALALDHAGSLLVIAEDLDDVLELGLAGERLGEVAFEAPDTITELLVITSQDFAGEIAESYPVRIGSEESIVEVDGGYTNVGELDRVRIDPIAGGARLIVASLRTRETATETQPIVVDEASLELPIRRVIARGNSASTGTVTILASDRKITVSRRKTSVARCFFRAGAGGVNTQRGNTLNAMSEALGQTLSLLGTQADNADVIGAVSLFGISRETIEEDVAVPSSARVDWDGSEASVTITLDGVDLPETMPEATYFVGDEDELGTNFGFLEITRGRAVFDGEWRMFEDSATIGLRLTAEGDEPPLVEFELNRGERRTVLLRGLVVELDGRGEQIEVRVEGTPEALEAAGVTPGADIATLRGGPMNVTTYQRDYSEDAPAIAGALLELGEGSSLEVTCECIHLLPAGEAEGTTRFTTVVARDENVRSPEGTIYHDDGFSVLSVHDQSLEEEAVTFSAFAGEEMLSIIEGDSPTAEERLFDGVLEGASGDTFTLELSTQEDSGDFTPEEFPLVHTVDVTIGAGWFLASEEDDAQQFYVRVDPSAAGAPIVRFSLFGRDSPIMVRQAAVRILEGAEPTTDYQILTFRERARHFLLPESVEDGSGATPFASVDRLSATFHGGTLDIHGGFGGRPPRIWGLSTGFGSGTKRSTSSTAAARPELQ